MKIITKFLLIIIIAILTILLVTGYSLNKKSSASKKNEISNFAIQLKIRNNQLAKIQKNLLEENLDINDLINNDEISFKKVQDNLKLIDFNGYNFSKTTINTELFDGYYLTKYSSNDILFNGNIGSVGTAYLDLYDNMKEYLKKKPVNPEPLLKYHIQQKNLPVKRISLKHNIYPKVPLKRKVANALSN